MFEAFYNLSENPFRLTPDPKFCYRHPSHDQAYAYLQYALKLGEGFIMVTGRPGIGKTTLAQVFLNELEHAEVVAARVASANIEATDLMRVVAYAYGIDVEGLDKATVLVRLRNFLEKQTRAGKRVVLIIDEAQGLPYPAIEELRLLADMQMDSHPLLQLFLVGQEKLRNLMQEPAMEQFQQRVIGVCHLEPLSLADTRAYMEHRLRKADWRGDPELTGEALLAIYRFSKGIPRHVNKICTRLLLDGFMEKKHELNESDVLEIANALRAERLAPLDCSDQEAVSDMEDSVLPAELEKGTLAIASLALRAEPQQPSPATTKRPAEVAAVVEETSGAGHAKQATAGHTGTPVPDSPQAASGTVARHSGNEDAVQRRRRGALSAASRLQLRRGGQAGIPAWKPTPPLKRLTHYLASAITLTKHRLSVLNKEFDFHATGARLRHYRDEIAVKMENYPALGSRTGLWAGALAALALAITLLLEPAAEAPDGQFSVMREEVPEPAGVALAESVPPVPLARAGDRNRIESASLESFGYRPVAPREEKRVNSDETAQRMGAVVSPPPDSPAPVLPVPETAGLAVDETRLSSAETTSVSDSADEPAPAVLSPGAAIVMLQDAEVPAAAPVQAAESLRDAAETPDGGTEAAQLEQVVTDDVVEFAVVVDGDGSVAEPVSREDRIIELLSLGQRALRDYRLLIPLDNNAYDYYQQVLELEPGNNAALFGLDQIVERYVALGNKALAREDKVKANSYISRGFRVMQGDSRLLALQARVNAPAEVQVEARPPVEMAEPKEKNLMSWLKKLFSEPQGTRESNEVPVDDYSF